MCVLRMRGFNYFLLVYNFLKFRFLSFFVFDLMFRYIIYRLCGLILRRSTSLVCVCFEDEGILLLFLNWFSVF